LRSNLRERSVAVAVGAIAIFLSTVTVAFAYYHTTNSTYHGLENVTWGHTDYPAGATNPPGTAYATAEVRHYFDDGVSWNRLCEDDGNGGAYCEGPTWGTARCQKRYVGGATGYLARHWVRWQSPPCGGQMHG
jgi:hypothetical protein